MWRTCVSEHVTKKAQLSIMYCTMHTNHINEKTVCVCVFDLSDQMESSPEALHDDEDVGENFEVKLYKFEAEESLLDTSCQDIDDTSSQSDRTTGSPEDNSRGIRNRGSLAWKYFVCRRTSAICKLCRKSFKRSGGNTSNLFQHLRRAHRKQYAAMMDESRRRKLVAVTSDMVCLPLLW